MPRKRIQYDASVVFRVAQLFFQGDTRVREIANTVNNELKPVPLLNRENVYPLLAEARRLGFVRLVAPLENGLAEEVASKFHCDPKHITVVRTQARELNRFPAYKAAEVALGLIGEVGASWRKPGDTPVSLGLGPGRATLDFSQHLSELLLSATQVPEIKLHAICAGAPAMDPQYSSTSFFNLFSREIVTKRVGLFAETVVRSEEFAEIKTRPGVKEAFQARDEISIVVTSMGDFEDEHDLLRMFLTDPDMGTEVDELRDMGWIGSVQYRPFSATGPIREAPGQMRAVTLFELEDFVRMADSKNKHVVLIARQCGICGKTRARSLRPLLTSPHLRVWSELVMDEPTARELVSDSR